MLNIAHRGACSLAPENTLAAAQKAMDAGADMWELDVGMTADGRLILIHDDTLERTSNVETVFPSRKPWSVHQFTLEEMRRLDFGSWFSKQDPFDQIAAGQVSQADLQDFSGESVPTLQEALAFTRDNNWRVNVEIKDLSGTAGDAKIVEEVVELIEDMQLVDQVLISSFNHRYLKRVKAVNPRLATGALVGETAADPVALLHHLDAQAYHPYFSAIQREAIDALRRQGFEVNVWTVNDEEMMCSLIQAGVSGIITDFPQRLNLLLEGRQ